MRIRTTLATAGAAASLVVTGMVTAAPANAAVLDCGTHITQNTKLTANVGPCGTDGLVITASNVTLNLNGFKVTGKKRPGDQAGIRLVNVTGVTVKGGTVSGFDAGVAIFAGSGNTVTNMTVVDNYNDLLDGTCDMGDGISMTNSNRNTITTNRVAHNGPFGGISVVEDSNANQIKNNIVAGNNIPGLNGCGNGGWVGNEDEGIRLEGPGANNNVVNNNDVSGNAFAGIGVHPNLGCRNNPPQPGDDANNDLNSITNNTVTGTAGGGDADGIEIIASGPLGTVSCAASNTTITGNNSSSNERSGIDVPATSANNTINNNVVNSNGADGIRLEGPLFNNTFTNNGGELLDLTSPNQPPFTPCTPDPATLACPPGTDFTVLSGSGSGNVTAPLVAVGPFGTTQNGLDSSHSGCFTSDFANFPKGAIALVTAWFCSPTTKVENALLAGASGVVIYNQGSVTGTGVFTDSVSATTIPVVGTSFAVGQQLVNLTQAGPVTIHLRTNTTNAPVQFYAGAVNNTLKNNTGVNNAERDGRDDNPHCDNNHWVANMFGTVNQPCVKAGGGTGQVEPTV
ncbi:MAG TPA: right-handed parallel beta-helix repeat-containing protein [Acidimicrobiales bacterium]|nr:right-handed parallel beta-helix repeat-containing protein [Acidimicrobiales bacterium]